MSSHLLFSLSLLLLLSTQSRICSAAPSSAAASAWDYKTNDPAHWPTQFKKYCGGRRQSPISLSYNDATYDNDLPAYTLNEENLAGRKYQVYNDGHKIVVQFTSVTSNITVPGHPNSCFRPHSVHWHWGEDDYHGSEHWMEGKHYPLEGHLFMWNCERYTNFNDAFNGFGGLDVIGTLFQPDSSTAAMPGAGLTNLHSLLSSNSLLQQCPGCQNESFVPPKVEMDAFTLRELLPTDLSQYYLYSGSLTTPDCRENLLWTVYRNPVRVPTSLMTTLRSLKYPDGSPMVKNFRPPQVLNPSNPFGARRMVVRSFVTTPGSSLPSSAEQGRANPAGLAFAVALVAAVATMLRI